MISKLMRGALLAFGVTTICLVACTSDEEKEKERQAEAARVEAAKQDAFTTTYCEIVIKCCNVVLQLPKDIPGCKKRIPIIDPVMIEDETARTDCLTQLRANTPRPEFCTEFGNIEQPACPDLRRKPLVGLKKVGEACATDADCAGDIRGAVACNSVCQLTKRGKEGEGPCIATIDGDVETQVQQSGDPEVVICLTRDGFICDPASKKCAKPIGLEKPCTDTRQCAPGTFCEELEHLCYKRILTGKACTQVDECEGFCKDEVCVAAGAEGAACDDKATFCAAGLGCTGGKCSRPPPDARLAGTCVD